MNETWVVTVPSRIVFLVCRILKAIDPEIYINVQEGIPRDK